MVSKIIEKQLKSCVYADLTNFDSDTNTYLINRYLKPNFIIGKCYLIKLPNNIVKNSSSTLAANWNNGTAPQNEYYKAYINKLVGKMMYVDCLAFDFKNKQDLNIMWSGYLPTDEVELIGEL